MMETGDNEDGWQRISANVQLAMEKLGPLSGIDFGLNRESVAWVEGFVERQRERPDFDAARIDGLVSVIGSFLGECVVVETGGRWQVGGDGNWGVLLPSGATAYPFAKTRKQFLNGLAEGDSIASFYSVVVDHLATKTPGDSP